MECSGTGGINLAHLNMPQLMELKELMEDMFEDLIETYLADSEEKLPRLETAINDANGPLCTELSHSLKGSSSNIYAEDLSDLLKNIEGLARADSLEQLSSCFINVQREFQMVKAELKELTLNL
jgi:HPt (histidine-containing phosphotransfer) domain-containing protein